MRNEHVFRAAACCSLRYRPIRYGDGDESHTEDPEKRLSVSHHAYFDLRNMNPAHSFLLDRPRGLFTQPTIGPDERITT